MPVVGSLEELSQFAIQFIKDKPKGAVVGLSGELGAGKTTFVRAAVESLRTAPSKGRVISPTFVLHQAYPELRIPIEHFDLYRLEKANVQSLLEIGYFDALERTRANAGFLFAEWPEHVADISTLELDTRMEFKLLTATSREILTR